MKNDFAIQLYRSKIFFNKKGWQILLSDSVIFYRMYTSTALQIRKFIFSKHVHFSYYSFFFFLCPFILLVLTRSGPSASKHTSNYHHFCVWHFSFVYFCLSSSFVEATIFRTNNNNNHHSHYLLSGGKTLNLWIYVVHLVFRGSLFLFFFSFLSYVCRRSPASVFRLWRCFGVSVYIVFVFYVIWIVMDLCGTCGKWKLLCKAHNSYWSVEQHERG